jgi:ketosteroid isomerase-like protein
MSNTDVINSAYAAFASGDVPQVLAVFAEGITWTEAAGHPYAGTYVGSDAIVQNIFMRLGAEWDEYQVKPDMLIAEGDRVAALGWYSGIYKETGRAFEARFVHWWNLADGKITSFEQIVDSAKVNEALTAG